MVNPKQQLTTVINQGCTEGKINHRVNSSRKPIYREGNSRNTRSIQPHESHTVHAASVDKGCETPKRGLPQRYETTTDLRGSDEGNVRPRNLNPRSHADRQTRSFSPTQNKRRSQSASVRRGVPVVTSCCNQPTQQNDTRSDRPQINRRRGCLFFVINVSKCVSSRALVVHGGSSSSGAISDSRAAAFVL